MADNLQHLVWHPLPEIEAERRRGRPPIRRTPLRTNQQQHGAALRRTLDGELQGIREGRREAGIESDHLLVLQLAFLEDEQRQILEERLDALVVDESQALVPFENPRFHVRLSFRTEEALTAFIQDERRLEEIGSPVVERVRGPLGSVHATRLDVYFSSKTGADEFLSSDSLTVNDGVAEEPRAPDMQRGLNVSRVLVQFTDTTSLSRFFDEWELYVDGSREATILTAAQRTALFDSLDDVGQVEPIDRLGSRLDQLLESDEFSESTYLDVDLWYPGSDGLLEAREQLRDAVERLGGEVTDGPRAIGTSLLIARIRGGREVAEWLARYDRCARVDLRPELPPVELSPVAYRNVPDTLPQLPTRAPLAAVLDTGVIAGHPLMDGVVLDEEDFQSGEDSTVDQVGHGSLVAGIVVYGDVARCIADDNWIPAVRILNGKIMRRGVFGQPEFPDERRIELQMEDAIRGLNERHGCRVFNLSIGHLGRIYAQGRQHPWALLLDELSRELDVVIVVPTGNEGEPIVPATPTEPLFRQAVREQVLDGQKIIDPACSAISLTVGGIAQAVTSSAEAGDPPRRVLVASPQMGPSPFSRSGHVETNGSGLKRSVKPDLVAPAGNYFYDSTREQWGRNDPLLGVPSISHKFATEGRLLGSASGTSFAAPYVTHICARLEDALSSQFPNVSANLIRALAVNSASVPDVSKQWLCVDELRPPENSRRVLRVLGYGLPNPELAMYSTQSRVTLVAQENLTDDRFHLYEVDLPEDFVSARGWRELKVTLAFDPPVRGTRKEYLARTMWFEVFRGLDAQDVVALRSNVGPEGGVPASLRNKQLDLDTPKTTLQWSTVQSAAKRTRYSSVFNHRVAPNAPARLHVLVGNTKRFEHAVAPSQRYALVITLSHSDDSLRLHDMLRQRVTQQARVRV